MVLEKTLESPLDNKEIQTVHPKGNHPAKDPHLVGAVEGCGPQVRELGLLGAGNSLVTNLKTRSRREYDWNHQSMDFGTPGQRQA